MVTIKIMQLGLVTFVKLLFLIFFNFFSPFIFSLPISSPQPLPFAEFHSFAPVSIPSRVFFQFWFLVMFFSLK